MTTSYVVLSASLHCIEPLHALLIDILPRDMSLQDEPMPKDGGVGQNATNYNWSKSRHGRGRPGNVPWFLSNHLPTFPSFLASRVSSALNGVQLIKRQAANRRKLCTHLSVSSKANCQQDLERTHLS